LGISRLGQMWLLWWATFEQTALLPQFMHVHCTWSSDYVAVSVETSRLQSWARRSSLRRRHVK
jgi:hypothetical protein